MVDKPGRPVQLAVLGVSLEGFWLAMYLLVSSTWASAWSKATVVSFTVVSLAALIYCAVTQLTKKDLILLLMTLSFGYIAAFHLLGLLFFPGLISDSTLSFEYARSLLGIAVLLLAIYLLAALALYWLNAVLRRSTNPNSN
jgi:hypothetical protein